MGRCVVTRHAEHRVRERVGIPKKAVRRAAANAMTDGIKRTETNGALRRYLDYLYFKGDCMANNIVVYNDKIYLFNEDTLITILNVPGAHMKQTAKLMQKKRKQNGE